MKSLRTNPSRGTSGFSLLEMAIVMAIILMMASVTFMSLQPVLKQQRVVNSYNIVLSAMRQARDNAVAQRTSYVVTFDNGSNPHTVTVAPTFAGFQGALKAVTYQIPTDVRFSNESGIPTASSQTPDSFGTGMVAIDFGYTGQGAGVGGKKAIYFCPDGSAQDDVGLAGQCMGNLNNGVVYIARPGELLSSRALTVWGATGRIRGWRLYNNGAGGTVWQRQ
ncbi:MAG: prepilin-type N-terminal cleavage/methylation domain-containing protein [Acidobacteriales bacterium]|nr:prepilin-type N-terminal cleavage/methylation domain-containing protein [Terriglobales bacterium]